MRYQGHLVIINDTIMFNGGMKESPKIVIMVKSLAWIDLMLDLLVI